MEVCVCEIAMRESGPRSWHIMRRQSLTGKGVELVSQNYDPKQAVFSEI